MKLFYRALGESGTPVIILHGIFGTSDNWLGFGKAIAEKFAAGGWNLILTARRKEKLEAVATNLEKQYGVKTLSLVFDIQKKEDVFEYLGNLPSEWQGVDLLVNNAGLALGRDSFLDANLADWETMIDTNVKGLLYASKAVLPYLIKQEGHIINIGSTAGKEVYKDGNVYCATKHAVDAISKAQRIGLDTKIKLEKCLNRLKN